MPKKSKSAPSTKKSIQIEETAEVHGNPPPPSGRKLWPPPSWVTKISLALSIVIILLVALVLTFRFLFLNRIYPGISIAGINVSGLAPLEAQNKLDAELSKRLENKINLHYQLSTSSGIQNAEVNLSDNTKIDSSESVQEAYDYGRKKYYLLPIKLWIKVGDNLNEDIEQLSSQIDQVPIDSDLAITDNEITVTPSQPGLGVNKATLEYNLTTYINTGSLPSQELPLQQIEPNLSFENAVKIKNRLDQVKLNPIKLTFLEQSFELGLAELLPLIDLQNSKGDSRPIALNPEKTNIFIEGIAKKIDRPVAEPLFNYDPNSPNRVSQFQPPTEGQELDRQKTYELILEAMLSDQSNITLPVKVVEPKNKLTNDFGIRELIGQGTSNFAGSIENRIYNLKLAASRVNGVLVAPGEVFSFNNTIGDVTAATGYKQAYVIKSGRTVLDDGGGVCQVSTTLFRAALNAGLPIVSRTAHAYRVKYYENAGYAPGLDATTFYPTVDLKFKNDTPNHILIQAYSNGLNLYVDMYGTSDGRIVNLTKPVITGTSPPPPELRQDDPTLPKGTVKQVDFAAWGAKVNFKRTVTRNGEKLIDETFYSNYRPWQAVFLVGTKE